MLECKRQLQRQWWWQQHLQWKMERPGEKKREKNKENIAEMKTNEQKLNNNNNKKYTRKYKNKSKMRCCAGSLRHIGRVWCLVNAHE